MIVYLLLLKLSLAILPMFILQAENILIEELQYTLTAASLGRENNYKYLLEKFKMDLVQKQKMEYKEHKNMLKER